MIKLKQHINIAEDLEQRLATKLTAQYVCSTHYPAIWYKNPGGHPLLGMDFPSKILSTFDLKKQGQKVRKGETNIFMLNEPLLLFFPRFSNHIYKLARTKSQGNRKKKSCFIPKISIKEMRFVVDKQQILKHPGKGGRLQGEEIQ